MENLPPTTASRTPTPAASSSAPHTTVSYTAERVIGHGSFGVVFLARIVETGEAVAIKKVLQDRRFQCRELQLMRKLRHPNIAALRHCFYSTGERPDELYLNLVMDFYPDTLHRFSGMFSRQREFMPLVYVRVFMFQLLRALAYLHAPRRNIAHRDIKPQNLFLDPTTAVLTLGDFGSAKVLTASEASVSYVCSRYYRAPELIFGATTYTTAVDMWSVGCVAAELLLGQPLFPGDGAVGQMIEIIKVLGTPTPDEIRSMNKTYTDFDFPLVRALPWQRVFRSHTPPEAADLVAACLRYDPAQRVTAADALAHPFFDELRSPGTRLPNGAPLPPLFDLSDEERAYLPLALQQRILPAPSVLHSPSFLGGKVVAAATKV